MTEKGRRDFCIECRKETEYLLQKKDIVKNIKDKEYPLLDIGIAANNICMQATELGLGSCILGWFDEKGLKQLLDVPEKKRIPLVISLGYSAAITRKKIRKPLKEIVHFNSYKR